MSDAISRSAESEIYPIDGEALFNAVQNLKRYDIRRNMFEEIAYMHMFKDQDVLNTILSAERLDVEPVVHARWIHEINNLYGCSKCMKRETMSHKKRKKYCPNCGAKMDGEADE